MIFIGETSKRVEINSQFFDRFFNVSRRLCYEY